jgi:BirA family transcriptional regulator, biotin operon repressor / biotin---[acetyl-CoA-carboxylase] ligase
MTVGINRKYLPNSRLSLLPLEIGIHLWHEVATQIRSELHSQLTLKWPNDLMFQGAKVAGILMEFHGKFMLIGIGINVAVAPLITDGGSPSGSLADAGLTSLSNEKIIAGLYHRIIQSDEAAKPSSDVELSDPIIEKEWDLDSILVDWQAKIDWNRVHRLRDRPGQPRVRPIMINRQGHLQVEHSDGSREWLIADYLA